MRELIYIIVIVVLMSIYTVGRITTVRAEEKLKIAVRRHNRKVLLGIKDKDYLVDKDLFHEDVFFQMNNTGTLPAIALVYHYSTRASEEDLYF